MPAPERTKGCIDCKHSSMTPRPGDKTLIRICHRFPPQIVGFSTAQGGMVQTVFPQVEAGSICGEFDAHLRVLS